MPHFVLCPGNNEVEVEGKIPVAWEEAAVSSMTLEGGPETQNLWTSCTVILSYLEKGQVSGDLSSAQTRTCWSLSSLDQVFLGPSFLFLLLQEICDDFPLLQSWLSKVTWMLKSGTVPLIHIKNTNGLLWGVHLELRKLLSPILFWSHNKG